jgi:hypothetical protein
MPSKSPELLVSLSFLLSGVAAAAVLGIAAASISATGWAPVGIFSIGVGVAVGTASLGLAHGMGAECPARLVVATLIMALVAVAAQHAWLYRDYRQQWWATRQREPALALFRPEKAPMSPAAYLATEYSPARLVLWIADAALETAAAVGTVLAWRGGQRASQPCSPTSDLRPPTSAQ